MVILLLGHALDADTDNAIVVAPLRGLMAVRNGMCFPAVIELKAVLRSGIRFLSRIVTGDIRTWMLRCRYRD